MSEQDRPAASQEQLVELSHSRNLPSWLQNEKVSIAFTTYQTCRLFLLGLKPSSELSAFERVFDRAMGLWATPEQLYVSTRHQLWQLTNALGKGERFQSYDRLYVPRLAHTTGDLDIHDIALDDEGALVFVNTLYSCLARLSDRYSFTPIWKPKFISKLAPEDRCHLNGLAMVDGQPGYVSVVGRTDVYEGWRDKRGSGGAIIDVRSSEIVATGLSMPHSPRVYRDKLWVLNSGTGEFGQVDTNDGHFEPVTFCPGYIRGLAFVEDYAVIGLSKARANRTFTGLELDQRLEQKNAEARCAIMVIDLRTGDIAHWIQLDGLIRELYDVQVLPGVRQAMSLGIRTDEISRTITIDPEGPAADRGVPTFSMLPASEKHGGQPTADAPPGAPLPPRAKPAQVAVELGPQRFKADQPATKFTVFENVESEQVLRYEQLTFPSIEKRWQSKPPQGPVDVAVALQEGELKGAAVLELNPATAVAEMVSLFVSPDQQRQGIGAALVALAEKHLSVKDYGILEVNFRSDWRSVESFKRLLKRRDWADIQVPRIIHKTHTETISRTPWLADRSALRSKFVVFPWQELTPRERAKILAEQNRAPWFPQQVTPFQEEDRIEHVNSLGVRFKGEVIGWMITHRLTADTIQYTALFMRPDLQRKGWAARLLAESINRQLESRIPYYVFLVDAENTEMLGFVDKYLRPYLTTVTEALHSHKRLG